MTWYIDLRKARKPRAPSKAAKNVWKAMRHARRFDYAHLQTVTGLGRRSIEQILWRWRQAGIVRDDNDGFRLARDLGPLPPFSQPDVNGLVSRKDGEVLPFEKLREADGALDPGDAVKRRRASNNAYAKRNRARLNARRRARRRQKRAG
jgi:hypothetical protein